MKYNLKNNHIFCGQPHREYKSSPQFIYYIIAIFIEKIYNYNMKHAIHY